MISRITQNMQSARLLENLQLNASRLSELREQMVSGKEILKPSDNPQEISKLLALKTQNFKQDKYLANLDFAASWSMNTDTALSGVSQSLARAKELVAQAASPTLSTAARSGAIAELEAIIEDIKLQTNTQVNGSYLFAGNLTGTAPYTAGGVDNYSGNTSNVSVEVGNSTNLNVNTIGQQVIGDNTQGALFHLRAIIADLQTGTPASLENARTNGSANLDQDIASLNSLMTKNANLERQISGMKDSLQRTQELLQESISNLEDADLAETYLKFQNQQVAYEAALKTGSRLLEPSLLDFLK